MPQKASPSAGEIRRQRDLEVSLRKLYFHQADILIRHFDRWKDNPEYYFIEIKLDMTYVCAGFAARVADPPYYLGTIIRNSLKNPDLFSCECPRGHRAWAYAYSGSPLSGRFDLGMACPECGWNGWVTQRGWKMRSDALKATQEEDAGILKKVRLVNPDFQAADIRDLLRSLGVSKEELVLPPLEHKVERTEMPDGTIILNDPDGGSVIISTDRRITMHNWNGPKGMLEKEIDRLVDAQKPDSDGE